MCSSEIAYGSDIYKFLMFLGSKVLGFSGLVRVLGFLVQEARDERGGRRRAVGLLSLSAVLLLASPRARSFSPKITSPGSPGRRVFERFVELRLASGNMSTRYFCRALYGNPQRLARESSP